jgi:IclR family KDG regulon transcriptional repressor
LSGDKRRYRIRSLERGLQLLQTFSVSEPELSHTDLCERLNLSPATMHRLLATLEANGYVERNRDNNHYRLGPACLRLGSIAFSQVGIQQQLRPILEDLRDQCRETVHLAIFDANRMEVVYLEKLESLLPIGFMGSRIGGRSPAHCTGLGKCLLAYQRPDVVRDFYAVHDLQRFTPNTIVDLDELERHLAQVRAKSYAIDNEEHEPDVKCVAAPIRNHLAEVVGAISIAGPIERMDRLIAEDHLTTTVQAAAERASRSLGYVART